MTETARMADVVLPATMFMEHDDVYQGGGHQHIILGPQADRAAGRMPAQSRGDLRARASASAPSIRASTMTRARDHRRDLAEVGVGTLERLERDKWIDCQPDFETAHYLKGFAYPEGKFRFKPDWPKVPFRSAYPRGRSRAMPKLPDHWTIIEEADAEHPFRLATSPARSFLNSTFNETPSHRARRTQAGPT